MCTIYLVDFDDLRQHGRLACAWSPRHIQTARPPPHQMLLQERIHLLALRLTTHNPLWQRCVKHLLRSLITYAYNTQGRVKLGVFMGHPDKVSSEGIV